MDQLIIQIISLMDRLMKDVDKDLRLTIYQVLAYSVDDGIMEFVPNSSTLQDILSTYKKEKLTGYFKHLTKERRRVKGEEYNNIDFIDEDIIENYIESLAGYCVITYFLGIGDRHLENLMLDDKGKIFHIDFGFSMGEDPKMSNPPPFKLNTNMIAGIL